MGAVNAVYPAYTLSATEDDTQKMMFQANVQGISMSTKYRYILFRRADNQEELPNRRKEILEAYRKSSLIKYARIAMIGENVGILFWRTEKKTGRKVISLHFWKNSGEEF